MHLQSKKHVSINAKLFGTKNQVTLKAARQCKTKGYKITVDEDEDIGVLHEIYFLQG